MDVAQAGLLWADTTAPGSLFASFPSTSGTVNGSNATNHHNEHYYSGKIEPAKEVDCMLIWDEALQVRQITPDSEREQRAYQRLPV